jgi:hypothetical protein
VTPRRRSARTAVAALLALCVLAAGAFAAPGRVLVLPLEGDAPPAVRTKYTASVQRMARSLGGKLATGDATFTDTATAIGCDPKAPSCAEDVRATLGVDELVYGTVSKQGDGYVLVVVRATKGKPRREVTATLQASDPPERAEPTLLPMFHEGKPPPDGKTTPPDGKTTPPDGKTTPPDGKTTPPDGKTTPPDGKRPPDGKPPLGTPPESRRDRTLGIAAVVGGGTFLLISLALWSSASGLQDDIDAHSTDTYADFQNLREIEDTARSRAWTGNAMFVAGLALGGLGGWLLYRDRKAHRAVVAPAPMASGAGITFTWLGGL